MAFPTETVYGLGADAFNAAAIAGIYRAKGRPSDNPLIVHVASVEAVGGVAAETPPHARRLIEAFFPGPLTLVLPRSPRLPAAVSAGLETVGVRMPADATAQAFLAACRTPVAAPSANRSGRPSPTSWQAVREDLEGRIGCILQSERSRYGLESTVVDCTGAAPVVLRSGSITLEMLRRVAPEAHAAAPGEALLARSPGTRHRHYAPTATVHVVERPDEAAADAPYAAYIGLTPPPPGAAFLLTCVAEDAAAYSYELFAFFRESDRRGARRIYCQAPPETGVGVALLDRIRRAALR